MYGKTITEETRAKISASLKGLKAEKKNNPIYGNKSNVW
jgi:hypothetical protein